MTKGLRCPNCDTTIHRKTVHDWMVNKKTPYLSCKNAFCNTRWRRAVLERHAAEFSGEVKATAPKPKKVAAESIVIKKVTRPTRVRRPAMRTDQTWSDRIRIVARQFASINGTVSVDDLRSWADKNYMQPPSSSAWGSVFRGEHWKKVSKKRSSYAKSRSRQVSVWALKASHKVAV